MQNYKTAKDNSESKAYYRFFCGLIMWIFAVSSFYFVWIDFVSVNNITGHLLGYGNRGMAIMVYSILYISSVNFLNGFKIGAERKANLIAAQIIALFMTDAAEVLASIAITGQIRFVLHFIVRYAVLFIIQSVVLSLMLLPMISIFRRVFPPIRMVEIHGDYENELIEKVNSLSTKYAIQKSVYYKDADIKALVPVYDAVLINDIPSQEKNKILKYCFENEKRVYFTPKLSDIIVKASQTLNLIDTPLYYSNNRTITRTQAFIKRTVDIVLSVVALVISSPILLITAALIKLEDGGPVFFRQKRYSLGGRVFTIIKFRSMIVDAEKDGRPHPTEEDDSRITKVGRVIRASRIDELPQLINILKGDMSLVGPRPERVEHVEKFIEDIPEFMFRNKMKGGLTGYAQVYGRYNTTALDKVKMDMVYITNYSPVLDLQIMIDTLKILLQKESTQGFSKEDAESIRKGSYLEEKNV